MEKTLIADKYDAFVESFDKAEANYNSPPVTQCFPSTLSCWTPNSSVRLSAAPRSMCTSSSERVSSRSSRGFAR